MDATYDPIIDLIPQGYRGIAIVLFVGIPYLTRAYHALVNNGGFKGVWNAIMFGTNGPKILIACLCLLALPSCTGALAFLASPGGQVIENAAVSIGKDLAKRGEVVILRQSIDNVIAQIAKYEAQGEQKDIGAEIVRQSKLAGLQAAKAALQQQYKGATGLDYPIAYGTKNPVKVTP